MEETAAGCAPLCNWAYTRVSHASFAEWAIDVTPVGFMRAYTAADKDDCAEMLAACHAFLQSAEVTDAKSGCS